MTAGLNAERNLVLIGLMGTGKSTVGRLLAQALGRQFVDTDVALAAEAGMSIPEIFAREGEDGFRRRETEAVRAAMAREGLVVATGGGAPLRPENRAQLRRGLVVWLQAPAEVLLARALADGGGATRPLLQGDAPLARLQALAEQRDPAYAEVSHLQVATSGRTPEQVVAEILALAASAQGAPEQRVRVALGERAYDIVIAPGALGRLGNMIATALPKARRALVVTDSGVPAEYTRTALDTLTAAGVTAAVATVPEGDASKSLQEAGNLYEACLDGGLERSGVVIALGGGMAGDLGGFVAATYLRGVAFVQVPTTLLAMVDASVGGKVAVNLPRGKNLVGAFHQPRLVLADPQLLASLPPRAFAAGMAEVIKHGVIADPDFFAWLEQNADAILQHQPEALTDLVAVNCRIKAAVVSADEREETGLRATLNFGHTTAHAIEAVQGYGGLLHGEAVAIGMVAATDVAAQLGVLQDAAFPQRLAALLQRYGLPVRLPGALDVGRLMAAMKYDKKASGGAVRWVLPVACGQVAQQQVPSDAVAAALHRLLPD